jgi:DNA-binding IclR family transcriptional regulator
MGADGGVMLIRKVSQILGVLAEGDTSAADLADAVGEPRSSVYRILSSMRAEGLVEPGRDRGQFRLGLRLLTLASSVVSKFDVRAYARPALERLYELTGETVFVCVPRDDRAVCIERLDGKRVQSLALKLGGSLPLHAGAAPRAILAALGPAKWDAYLANHENLESFTPKTPVKRSQLLPLLKKAVAEGIAVSDQDVTVGVAAIGAAIIDYQGQVCGALSISGIRDAIIGDNFPAWSTELRSAATEVSRSLGAELVGVANLG